MSTRSSADERLLTLVGCIQGLVLELDRDARYLHAWADDPTLLARPAEELVGRTIDEVLGEEVGAPFTQAVKRVHRTGVVESLEYPLDVPSGRRWFFADIKRVGVGDAATVVFFARDITDRKNMEEALRASDERYRLAMRATNDVIWDWDVASGTVQWNDVALTVFGGVEPTLEGWRTRVHSEDEPRVTERLKEAMARGDAVWTDSYRFAHRDGEWLDIVDRATIVRDAEGRPVRLVGSMTDVTERKRLQTRLLQADRLAALGLLAAGVGHEINNPLCYVMSNVESSLEQLVEGGDARSVATALHDALDGADRIRRIVDKLKTLGIERTEREAGVRVDLALQTAIGLAENELRHRGRLVLRIEPTPTVLGSQADLTQVFLDLLVHAALSLPDGRIEENEVSVHAAVDVDGRVCVRVRNSGAALTADELAHVFDPFFTRRAIGGKGFGLALCRHLVEQMGAEIVATSDGVRGSELVVRLLPTPTTHDGPGIPGVLVIDAAPAIGKAMARADRAAR